MFLFIHVCFKSNISCTYVWAVYFACVYLLDAFVYHRMTAAAMVHLVFSTSSILYNWLFAWSPTKDFSAPMTEWIPSSRTYWQYVNKHAIARQSLCRCIQTFDFSFWFKKVSCIKFFDAKNLYLLMNKVTCYLTQWQSWVN